MKQAYEIMRPSLTSNLSPTPRGWCLTSLPMRKQWARLLSHGWSVRTHDHGRKGWLVLVLLTLFLSSCGDSKSKRRRGGSTEETPTETTVSKPDTALPATAVSTPPQVKVFIENSLSMDGYVKNSTQFEAALSDLLVLLSNYYDRENLGVNLINSKIYPSELKEVQSFVDALEPNSAVFNQGQRGTSRLNDVIEKVLNETGDNDISVMVSDCIYSLDERRKQNTAGALNFEKALTKGAFFEEFKKQELSTVVLRLNSDFEGNYYDKTDRPTYLSSTNRPYYIWVLGNKRLINKLLNTIQVENLSGFEAKYVLSQASEGEAPYYSILSMKNKLGRSKPSRESGEYVHGLEDIEFKEGAFQFTLALNMKAVGADEKYITEPKNYTVTEGFRILSIEPATAGAFKPQEQGDWRAVKENKCTHLITVAANKNFADQTISIALRDQTPTWVREGHSDDDEKIKQQLDKTFGIRYLIEGVAEAYRENARSRGIAEPSFFTLNIDLRK